MTNPADEIRAACRTVIYLQDCMEAWAGDYDASRYREWQREFHEEAVKLLDLLKDHAPTYWDEKKKDRRDEFKEMAYYAKQGTYPPEEYK